MYRVLDAEKTISTLAILNKRIEERFPSSNIGGVCSELHQIAKESKDKAEWMRRPHIQLRILVSILIILSLSALILGIIGLDISWTEFSVGEFVQVSEAAVNNIIFIGAAIFFLVTAETRIKRTRALDALHELRVIAHVIDMHQLTKDPNLKSNQAILTPSSPKREMSNFELHRYLDYCTEMLSLTGKVAALYAQDFRDSVVLAAVNEVENLTTGLSRKIWQKIMILHKAD